MTRGDENKCRLICGPKSLPDRLNRVQRSGDLRVPAGLGQRYEKKVKDVDNRHMREGENSKQHEETEIKRCYGGEENEEKADPQKDDKEVKSQTKHDAEHAKPCQMLLKRNTDKACKDHQREEKCDKSEKYPKGEDKGSQYSKAHVPETDNRFSKSYETENRTESSVDKRFQNIKDKGMRVAETLWQKDEIPHCTDSFPYLQNITGEPSAPSNSNLKEEHTLGLQDESVAGHGISELNFLDISPVEQAWNIGGHGKNMEKHLSNIFISLKKRMDAQEGIDEITTRNTLRSLMDKLHVKLNRKQFLKVMEAIGMNQGSQEFFEYFNLLSMGGDLELCKVACLHDGALKWQEKVDPRKNETSDVHELILKKEEVCPENDEKLKSEENQKEENTLKVTETGINPANDGFEGDDSGLGNMSLEGEEGYRPDPENLPDEVDKSLEEEMEKHMNKHHHDSGLVLPVLSEQREEFDSQGKSDDAFVDQPREDSGIEIEEESEKAFDVSRLYFPDQTDGGTNNFFTKEESIQGLVDQLISDVAKYAADKLNQNPFLKDYGGSEETKSYECLAKQSGKTIMRQICSDRITDKSPTRGIAWKRMKRNSTQHKTIPKKKSPMIEKDPGFAVKVLSGKVNVKVTCFRTKSCMSSAGNKGGNSSFGGKGGNSPSGGKGSNSTGNTRGNDENGSEKDNRSNEDGRNSGDGGGSLPVSFVPTAALVDCNIPGQDFKSVRKKHSNITDDQLIYLLGSLSLDTGPDIQEDPGLLGEVDHCLRILLHSLPNHTDPDCSVCSIIHSLISHFANCTQVFRQCQVCWQTLQLALRHVHRCIQEGSRCKESQTDVCFQLTKAADGQADRVKDKSERLWIKMKKCAVKVFQPVGLHGSGSLGMYSLVENEEANFSGLTTSSMASSDHSGLSIGSGTSQVSRSPGQAVSASSSNGQFQRVGSGRYTPSLRSIPESPRRNGSLRRSRKISRQVSNESARSPIGSKSDDTSLPESQKSDVAEASSTGELGFMSLPNSTAEPISGPLDDISVTTSLSSASGQNEEGQTGIEFIYERYKPMMERDGNLFPESRSTKPCNQDPYETQKTYGTVGVISLPIRPNIQQEREQLLSLELGPTGEPGIGEVVYGTRRQIMKVAQYWARIRRNMDNESYKHQIREEGVILDSAKRNLRILRTRYQKKHQWLRLVHLGNGVAGKCHLARDATSGFKFCVKRVHIAKYEENELVTWSDLDHSNIVKLYGAIRHGNKIYIFCEFIAGGSLTSLINEQRSLNRRLSHWMCIRYFKQLLQVLIYLRSKNILHEDLKADNILIRQSSTLIAVADFGLARSMNVDSEMKGMSPTGSQTQWSPEKATSMGHGFAADVWAAVCILVHMLSGHPPWTQRYPGLQMLHFVIFTQSPPLADVPANIQEVMRDLITQGFTVDPTLRPSAGELLDHQAFKILDQGPPDTYYSTLVNSGQVIPNNLIDNSVKGPQELDSILNSLDTRRQTMEASGLEAAEPKEASQDATETVVYTRSPHSTETMKTDDKRDVENGKNSASGYTNQGSGPKTNVVSPGTSEEDSRNSMGSKLEGSGSLEKVISPGTSEEDSRSTITSRLFGTGHGDHSSSPRKYDSSAGPGDQSSASSTNKSPGTDTREEGQLFGNEHNLRVISDEGSSTAGPVVLNLGSLPLPPEGSGAVGDRSSDYEGNQPHWSILQVSMNEGSEGQSFNNDSEDHISQYLKDDQSIIQYTSAPYPRLTEYCPPPKDSIKPSDNFPKWTSLLDNPTFSFISLDPTDSYKENLNQEMQRTLEMGAGSFDVPDMAAGLGGIVQLPQNDDNIQRQTLQLSPIREPNVVATAQRSPAGAKVPTHSDISRQTGQNHGTDSSTRSPISSGQSNPFHQRSNRNPTPTRQDQDTSGANSPVECSGQASGNSSPIPNRSKTGGQGYVSPSQHAPLRTEYIDLPIINQTPVGNSNEDPFPTSYYPPSMLYHFDEHVNSDELFGDRTDPESFKNFGKNGQSSSSPLKQSSPAQTSAREMSHPGQFQQSPPEPSRDFRGEDCTNKETSAFQGARPKVSKSEAKNVKTTGFMFPNDINNSSASQSPFAKQRSASTNGSTLKGGTADYALEPKIRDSGSHDNLHREQEGERSPKKNKNLTLDVNRKVPKYSNYHRVVSEPANFEKAAVPMSHPKTCPEVSTIDTSGIGSSIQYNEPRNSSTRSSDPSGLVTPERSRHISNETSPSTPKSQFEHQEKEFSALSQSDVESSHEQEMLAMQETFEEDEVKFTVGPGSFQDDLESVQRMLEESHNDLGHKYRLLGMDKKELCSILVLPRQEEWRDIIDIIRTAVRSRGLEHFNLKMADDQLVDYNAQLTHEDLQIKVCPVSEDEVKAGQSTCWCENHHWHFH